MSISSKHHYLPEFYLKGFTNSKEVFSIYDHSKKQIKKGEHSPSSHFFEKDRNSAEFEGRKTDLPEQHYNFAETKQAKILQKIQSSELISLNADEMILLQEFVSSIFWRIPSNDRLYIQQFEKGSLLDNSYKIINKVTGETAADSEVEKIRTSEIFIKSLRPAAAGVSLLANRNNNFHDWGITYTKSENRICSDNPILFRNENATNIFESDFIFPITKNHLLLKLSKRLRISHFPSEFSLMTDILILKLGNIYSCSANRDYLITISKMAEYFTIDQLKNNIFNFIDRSTNG